MASATVPGHGQSAQFDHGVGIDTQRDFHVAPALASNGGRLGELPSTASGNSRHHRLNQGGIRQANATLHRIAVVRLRGLKRFIAREVFHLLMGKPPRRTSFNNLAQGLDDLSL